MEDGDFQSVPLLPASEETSKAKSIFGGIFSYLKMPKSPYTKRQWLLLACFGLSNLLASATLSLQAPFYPAEAERKGATATEYGVVFGIFDFIVFITSPFFGKYINRIGPRRVYTVCVVVTSVAVISFGLLDAVNDHTWFISLSIICRLIEGLGCGGFFPATLTIIACEFPDSVAGTISIIETTCGLGVIIGPTLGAALYTVGGFTFPFIAVGIAQLLSGLLSIWVMPKIDRATAEDGSALEGTGIMTLLKIPAVALISLSIMSSSISLEYLSAVLEPHIRQFSLTPMGVGLMFVACGGMYAIFAPICGCICDRMRIPMKVALVGNILNFLAFLLIGPASFMPFETIQWVTIVGLLIEGVGVACCIVSGFSVALKECIKHNLPDNIDTNGAVSGLWQSMIALGSWVGPISAGILYDHVGFRNGSWMVFSCSSSVAVMILILILTENHPCWKLPKSESTLLTDEGKQLFLTEDTDPSVTLKPFVKYGSVLEI